MEDEEFIEGAEYSPKSEFSKPKIVYEAVQKCIQARAKEMRAGYYNTKMSSDGTQARVWVEDSRQVFIGSVIALKSLLSAEIMGSNSKDGSNGFKEKIKTSEDKIIETKKDNSYEELLRKKSGEGIVWYKTGRKFIPEVGSVVVLPDPYMQGVATQIRGGWDDKTNLYWDLVLQEYDLMFACLNRLINQLNFFKQKINY